MEENTNKAVETAVETAAEAVTEVAKAVPASTKKINKDHMIATGAGFAGGVLVIALAKPTWKLVKKAGGKVRKGIQNLVADKPKPAEGSSDAAADKPENKA